MSTENIRRKNDIFRKTFLGGKVFLTQAVQESDDVEEVLTAVQNFTDFTPKNDPHEEHDFGKITINKISYFFKIDYYDDDYMYFKEDGNRVLTIMRADEY